MIADAVKSRGRSRHGIACWRPLRQWRRQTGGTERRPTMTICNLRDGLHLPLSARRARVAVVDQEEVSSRAIEGGNTSREGVFPSVFPLFNR